MTLTKIYHLQLWVIIAVPTKKVELKKTQNLEETQVKKFPSLLRTIILKESAGIFYSIYPRLKGTTFVCFRIFTELQKPFFRTTP